MNTKERNHLLDLIRVALDNVTDGNGVRCHCTNTSNRQPGERDFVDRDITMGSTGVEKPLRLALDALGYLHTFVDPVIPGVMALS